MSVLHVSDAHAGDLAPAGYGDLIGPTGLPNALESVKRCLSEAVDIALERRVDAFIHSGDLFHRSNPTAIAQNVVDEQLRRLEGGAIPVVLIDGNHERGAHAGDPSILEVFRRPGISVATRPCIVHAGDVAVACLPNSSVETLMAANPGISWSGARDRMTDALAATLGLLRDKAPEGSVLALHWSIQGCVGGSERDLSVMVNDPVIPLADLEGPWSYVAAGHIHRAQELGGFQAGCYAGSIDRRNFGEEDQPKVAIEADLATGTWTSHELEVARRFVTIDLDGSLMDSASMEDVDGAICRVKGPRRGDDVGSLIASMRRHGALEVFDETTPDTSVVSRDAGLTEALSPEVAFERWCDLREIPEDSRAPLRLTWRHHVEEAMSA